LKMPPAPQSSPLLIGAALLGAGLILRNWQPSALSLPEPPDVPHRDSGWQKAARRTRDVFARVLPGNMTGSIGRTLVIMGAGLVLIRLLDMAVDDQEALF